MDAERDELSRAIRALARGWLWLCVEALVIGVGAGMFLGWMIWGR